MLSLALQAGALATGAPTPGKGGGSKQQQQQQPQAIDLSSTLPRRNSEDEASWEGSPISSGSNGRTESEMGSPSVGINKHHNSSNQRDTFATHATKKTSSSQAHVALDLRAPPAVKKLRETSGAEPPKHIELSWDFSLAVKATKREAKLTGKLTKNILTNVAGTVKSGQMMAVMGSSGAGKSTFLDCVSLRNQQFTGNVFINNKPADESYYFMTGFIYQEDLFIPTMTVREHLTFHAMVRMGGNVTMAERLERVEDVLVEVAMSHCPETIIGGAGTGFRGISGGEKKRLAFGTELLNNPSIIFADEPTSGLDSFMTRGVCTTMRELADDGKIIMCVIHQPSSQTFDLFTHLLLLAKGRTVYNGPMSTLQSYFSSLGVVCPRFHNPADFFINQISIVPTKQEASMARLKMLWDAYEGSNLCTSNMAWKAEMPEAVRTAQHKAVSMKHFHASTYTQFYYTMRRNIQNEFRRGMEVKAKFMNSIVMGLILGTIYYGQTDTQQSAKNIMGLFFLVIMFQTMVSMFGVLQAFPSEVKVFIRENLSGANRVSSYFLARTLSELPNTIIYPTIFSAIVYGMADLQPTAGRFYFYLLTIVLVANSATSVGYMISSMTSHEAVAYALAPLFLMPMALFAGLLLDLNTIPVWLRWLDFFSIIKYGYQLLVINQYDDRELSCTGALFCRWKTGADVMKYVGTSPESLGRTVGILVALIIIFRVLALIFLTMKSNRAH